MDKARTRVATLTVLVICAAGLVLGLRQWFRWLDTRPDTLEAVLMLPSFVVCFVSTMLVCCVLGAVFDLRDQNSSTVS